MLGDILHLQEMVVSCNKGHFEAIPMAIAFSMPFMSQRVPHDAFQAHNLHTLH